MEQKFDNKAAANHRVIRIGAEEDCDKSIRCRSGLLISRSPECRKPKITILKEQNFNANPHPCVGVMYPAFLNDTPAEWRDLPPDGLTMEETENMVVLRT